MDKLAFALNKADYYESQYNKIKKQIDDLEIELVNKTIETNKINKLKQIISKKLKFEYNNKYTTLNKKYQLLEQENKSLIDFIQNNCISDKEDIVVAKILEPSAPPFVPPYKPLIHTESINNNHTLELQLPPPPYSGPSAQTSKESKLLINYPPSGKKFDK